MSIQYDEYVLLELFESEPDNNDDEKEAGFFLYSKMDKRNVELILSINYYERKCNVILILNINEVETRLTRLEMKNVSKMEGVGNSKLEIYYENDRKIILDFSPYNTLTIE